MLLLKSEGCLRLGFPNKVENVSQGKASLVLKAYPSKFLDTRPLTHQTLLK